MLVDLLIFIYFKNITNIYNFIIYEYIRYDRNFVPFAFFLFCIDLVSLIVGESLSEMLVFLPSFNSK